MIKHATRRAVLASLGSTIFGASHAAVLTCDKPRSELDTYLDSVLSGATSPSFDVLVVRGGTSTYAQQKPDGTEISGVGRHGQVYVNGTFIGASLENEDLKIARGEYRGIMRYVSGRNFVQGPMGVMANTGDFLLEVGGVAGRSHLLFHGGTKPWHSRGCILLGAVHKNSSAEGDVKRFVPDDNALRKLRLAYYGTDTPIACPDMSIKITLD